MEELNQAETWAKSNPKILEAVKEVGVDPEMLFCDGWCVSIDERFPGRRLQQVRTYLRHVFLLTLQSASCLLVHVLVTHSTRIH